MVASANTPCAHTTQRNRGLNTASPQVAPRSCLPHGAITHGPARPGQARPACVDSDKACNCGNARMTPFTSHYWPCVRGQDLKGYSYKWAAMTCRRGHPAHPCWCQRLALAAGPRTHTPGGTRVECKWNYLNVCVLPHDLRLRVW
jgi:hypothetical protein